MAASNPEYNESVLEEMNQWTYTIHDEIHDSGVKYAPTIVEPLSVEYRKYIGDNLRKNFGFDYTAVMSILDDTEAVYVTSDDLFLVCYDRLENFDKSDRAFLAHEKGHRLGRKIVEKKLEPIHKDSNVSDVAYEGLESYLLSENFAERTKVAVGETFGEDFDYDHKILGEKPAIYRLKNRICDEELIDRSQKLTIGELLEEIEDLVDELLNGKASWTSS